VENAHAVLAKACALKSKIFFVASEWLRLRFWLNDSVVEHLLRHGRLVERELKVLDALLQILNVPGQLRVAME
jgi:hypothetical protein